MFKKFRGKKDFFSIFFTITAAIILSIPNILGIYFIITGIQSGSPKIIFGGALLLTILPLFILSIKKL